MEHTVSFKKLMFYLLALTLAVGVALLFVEKLGYRRALEGIKMPRQQQAAGHATLQKDKYRLELDFQYDYEIEGLVVATKEYHSSAAFDTFCSTDIGMAWGDVARYNDTIDFHWMMHNRHLYCNYRPEEIEARFDPGGVVGIFMSNNHMIPSDDKTRRQISLIRTGDHIRVTGYLVDCRCYRNGEYYTYWNSSTSRSDSGDGACEIIYVTDVQWL